MDELVFGVVITVVGGLVLYLLQRGMEGRFNSRRLVRRDTEYESALAVQSAERRVNYLTGEVAHCLGHCYRIDPARRHKIEVGVASISDWADEVASYADKGLDHLAELRRTAREASTLVGDRYWAYVEDKTDPLVNDLRSRSAEAPRLRRVDVPDIGGEQSDNYSRWLEDFPVGPATFMSKYASHPGFIARLRGKLRP